MRLVFPSDRQMDIFYPHPASSADFNFKAYIDAYYSHATCIPDGL
jgi:hypothetical protein